jgi:16S rRNA (cytosine1402-N4)-methyltransferase
MMGRDGIPAAGGPARHVPVLGPRVVEWLSVKTGGLYVDATFGAGGYSREILSTAGARVIALDRDQSAVARGASLVQASGGRLDLVEERFSNLDKVVDAASADGVAFDVGVSSMQLDEADRGFSFRLDGPLDMRMGRSGPSAADIIARASERDLAAIIAVLGEEHRARAIARAIIRARDAAPIKTTGALADLVSRVVHRHDAAIHPATRTFQALRIFVNDELAELAEGLVAAEHVLKAGGRLVVVAFHSLEDRIVKTFLNERSRTPSGSRHAPERSGPTPTFTVLTRRPETPGEAEITAAPPRGTDVAELLPRLPSIADIMRGGR